MSYSAGMFISSDDLFNVVPWNAYNLESLYY